MPWACAGLLPPASYPQPACSPRDWPSPMANKAELGELTLGLDKEGRPRSQGQWSQCCALAVPHFSYCGQPLHQYGGCLSWFLFPPPGSAPAAPWLTPGCGAGGSVPLAPWQHQAEWCCQLCWVAEVPGTGAPGVPGLAACRQWQEPAGAVFLSVCSAPGTASDADQGQRPSDSQLLSSSEGRERGSCPRAFPTLERATMTALPSLKQHQV